MNHKMYGYLIESCSALKDRTSRGSSNLTSKLKDLEKIMSIKHDGHWLQVEKTAGDLLASSGGKMDFRKAFDLAQAWVGFLESEREKRVEATRNESQRKEKRKAKKS